MKKLMLASLLFTATISMNAQGGARTQQAQSVQAGDPVTRANALTEEIAKVVTLTADQKTKIYNVNLEKNKQVDAARLASGQDKDGFKVQRKRINGEREAAIKALLTPAQQATFMKAKQDNKNKAAQQRGADQK